MLANRAALSLRVDSQADWGADREGSGAAAEPTDEERAAYGTAARVGIERRLRVLEGKPLRATGTGVGPAGAGPGKWEVKEARKYNPDADGLAGNEPAAAKTNGTLNGDVKMIEEVDNEDESEPESDDEAEAGAEQAMPKVAKKADGELSKAERKALKAAEKEAKRARKAARAAKREAKAAKKEAKKRKAKAALEPAEGKKRKRDDEGEKGEKKKKKKSKD